MRLQESWVGAWQRKDNVGVVATLQMRTDRDEIRSEVCGVSFDVVESQIYKKRTLPLLR